MAIWLAPTLFSLFLLTPSAPPPPRSLPSPGPLLLLFVLPMLGGSGRQHFLSKKISGQYRQVPGYVQNRVVSSSIHHSALKGKLKIKSLFNITYAITYLQTGSAARPTKI